MEDLQNSVISGLIGAIVGAVVGAWASKIVTTRAQKVASAFDFHREFNDSSMGIIRGRADELTRKHPILAYDQLYPQLGSDSDPLFVILRFYQRLWLSIKHNHVNGEIVAEMFIDNFYFWYYISFEPNLIKPKVDWPDGPHMKELCNWFYQNTSADTHTRLMQKYKAKFAERKASLKVIV